MTEVKHRGEDNRGREKGFMAAPNRQRRLVGALFLCASALAPGGAVQADTLQEALTKAYVGNPDLTGARSQLRATDEGIAIARAGARPNVQSVTTYTEFALRNNDAYQHYHRQVTSGVDLTVPIYQGGAVANAIRAARTRTAAGQAQLRDTEAVVFAQTVAAYMDVIRDESIVALNHANVRVLETNLHATRDRFQVGDLTRTDVAQSEARLSFARSQLETSAAQLIASRENYIKVVGSPPGRLDSPPPLPNLPATPDEAMAIAISQNPGLMAAREESKAAGYDVKIARAEALPKVSAYAAGDYLNYLHSQHLQAPTDVKSRQHSRTINVGVRASIPLYQGGRPAAQVRQSQARESATLDREVSVERSIIAQTRSAYAAWVAAREVITSSESAVSSNRLSLEGVRAENSVGTRTILDVLNAEQELVNAQVQLVRAQRDSYVAGFSLLAAMGRADASDLGLDAGVLYDPVAHSRKMNWRLFDFDDDPKPKAQAGRTIDTPAQTPAVDDVEMP